MEWFKAFLLIATLSTLLFSVHGQINIPCTATMISSFAPCTDYITGSSSNGASPTVTCCSTLKSLMSTSMDCTCLVLTANVPLQLPINLPINHTLALSLPRACHMGPVPLQCKDSEATALAPASESETTPPLAAATPEVQMEAPASPAVQAETPAVQVAAPTTTAGIQPVLSHSASALSYVCPQSTLLIFIAIMVFKSY